MKLIFLISGMSSWENSLPIIYELSKVKKNKIILCVETKIFYEKFLKDQFRKNFLKKNNITFLHLGRPKSLIEYFRLLILYLNLLVIKFDYIMETLDLDMDLKLTNYFLKINLLYGCKRVKIFSDSLSEVELKNTQIFYDAMSIINKKLNFSKYDFTLISQNEEILKNVYKDIIFSKKNYNIGKIKFNEDWLNYINKFYDNQEIEDFDVLIPLSATKGKFLKGYESTSNENKLETIFEVLSSIKNISVIFKPHSKSDMDFFNLLLSKYKFKYLISYYHLNYLCTKSKIVLTYHPTSAQIYAKHFKKKVIEYGEYDKKIEKLLNGKSRYHESVDIRIKTDKEKLKNEIEFYIKNYEINNISSKFKEERLSSINEILKKS